MAELSAESSPDAKRLRVAIYARVSSAGQRERHTIESQLAELPRIAEAQGWELVSAPFVDDGLSGALPVSERPGLCGLMDAVDAGKVDAVAVAGLDRLTRAERLRERTEVIGRLQEAGVMVAEGANLIDLQRPEGELHAMIQGWVAAQYRRRLLADSARGRRRVLAEGRKPAGRVPYGYQYDHATGAWAIDPDTGPVVIEIFRRVIAGESCAVIAADLSARGVPRRGNRSHAGRDWNRSRIRYTVQSTTYRGEYPVQREQGVFLPVPPIVDATTWQRAQEALSGRASRDASGRSLLPCLLRGLLSCGLCGQPVRYLHRDRISRYVCRALIAGGRFGECSGRFWPADEVDRRVWERVEAWLCDEADATTRAIVDASAQPSSAKTDRRKLEAEIKRVDRAQRDALALARRGVIRASVRDAELAELAAERDRIEGQIASIEAARAPVLDVAQVRDALSSLRDLAGGEEFEDRRTVLQSLIAPGGIALGNNDIRVALNLDALVSAMRSSRGRTAHGDHCFAVMLAA